MACHLSLPVRHSWNYLTGSQSRLHSFCKNLLVNIRRLLTVFGHPQPRLLPNRNVLET
jgi:hypothetical protein